MQENPVGTGPYKLVKWSKKQEHLLVAQRRLLGAQARLQVRAHPDHPRAGHPDRRADLGRRGHHQGGAARPDGRDQQVGPGAHRRPRRSCARPCIQLDQAGRVGPEPVPGQARAAGRQPRRRHRRRSSSTCSTASATARRPPSTRWPSASTRPSSPTSRTWPRPRSCSPRPASRTASRSASCADPADRGARAHPDLRRHRRRPRQGRHPDQAAHGRRDRPLHEPGPRQQGRPDVRVVVGLLLGLRRRRHPLRRDDVQPAVQLLLQQGARRPRHPGPLHARREEAGGDLRQGPEAPLRRRRLPLQVGAARRVGRQQPDRLRGAARRGRPDVRS